MNRTDLLQSTADFLQTLFSVTPDHLFVEIRALPASLLAGRQRFFCLKQLREEGFARAVPLDLDGKGDIYFGIVPRVQPGHGGNENTDYFDRVWADYDNCDILPRWPLKPSVEWETSPGKRQAVWLLSSTVSREACANVNRRLAHATGADMASTNPERILRLPGLVNTKYETRPRCTVISKTGNRYDPEQINAAVPCEQEQRPRTSTSRKAPCCTQDIKESEEYKEELRDLMFKLGVSPDENPTWCFAHDDRREGGRPSLSVDWKRGQFKCHSPRCGVQGGIGSIRRLASGTPPFVPRMSSYEQTGAFQRDRLVAALGEVGEADLASAVNGCHRDFRAYRCKSCGKTPAYPVSCGFPLCPECMGSRFFAFWEKHREKLQGNLAMVRLTPNESFPLAKQSMSKVRARFKEWRGRYELECGLYALVPLAEGERCQISVLLVIPRSELGKIGKGRAFQVEAVADYSSEEEARCWLSNALLEGVTSWNTTTEMAALWTMLKGTPLVFGFGQWHRIRGGRAKGIPQDKVRCPFCGGELVPLGVVPQDSVAIEEGQLVWRPPPVGNGGQRT